MEDWIPLADVNFSDPKIKQYHVDTRDFHCICNTEENNKLDLTKIINYPDRFFLAADDVRRILERLFNESGGSVTWRMLNLTGPAEPISFNWGFKYIRIYRHPLGLIMCNSRSVAMRRDYWDCPVDQEYLNAH